MPTTYLGDFFLRREIKDMIALLELCHGPDGLALVRLARWGDYKVDSARVEVLVGAARTDASELRISGG